MFEQSNNPTMHSTRSPYFTDTEPADLGKSFEQTSRASGNRRYFKEGTNPTQSRSFALFQSTCIQPSYTPSMRPCLSGGKSIVACCYQSRTNLTLSICPPRTCFSLPIAPARPSDSLSKPTYPRTLYSTQASNTRYRIGFSTPSLDRGAEQAVIATIRSISATKSM